MRLRSHAFAALISIAAWGCAAKSYQASFNSPLLQPRDNSQITKNGVTIAVEPITRENVLQFPDVVRMASWRQPDPAAQHPIGMGAGITQTSQIQMVPRSGPIIFVPLPAFRVRLANGGNQPLSFASRDIHLEDNLRRQYAPIVDAMTLRGRFVRDVSGTNSYVANDASMMRAFINVIDQLPILGPGMVIPPGGTWMGYAMFETGAIGGDEYNLWMNSVQNLALRLQSSGAAGGGPEFAFNLDKQNKLVALTCPSDAKTPSLERCSRDENVSIVGSGLTRPEGTR